MAEKDVPSEDRICKCGHTAARHISDGIRIQGANNQTWCYERFCSCSKFVLNTIR